jgi:hypothetical protein
VRRDKLSIGADKAGDFGGDVGEGDVRLEEADPHVDNLERCPFQARAEPSPHSRSISGAPFYHIPRTVTKSA